MMATKDQKPKRPRGHPSKFTNELATEICARLSMGEPLAAICRDEHMPTDRTVRTWQNEREEFASAIARAREDGFDQIAAGCLDIADSDPERTPSGTVDAGAVQHAKLRIETRLKLLAKWDPKRYGERMNLEHSGKVGLESIIAASDDD